MIPSSEWQWFGWSGHFILGEDCRFHLCTQIGDLLVSTVGALLHDAPVREILASERKVTLEGRGDARRADYMKKIGYDEIGVGRMYETMVFKLDGRVCDKPDCNCGLPFVIPTALATKCYNDARSATAGHMELCERVACGEIKTDTAS